MKKAFLILISLIILGGCGGGTRYVDPADAEGSRKWGPKEIKVTVDKMTKSLYDFLKIDYNAPAFIRVIKVRNRTDDPTLDTKMLAEEIVTNLVKKRIRFIDETYTEEQIKDIAKKYSGLYDESTGIDPGNLKLPNLYLYGEVSNTKDTVGGDTVEYLVVTLTLKDTSTNFIEWKENQKFLKITSGTDVGW